jgi:hypothetical protein
MAGEPPALFQRCRTGKGKGKKRAANILSGKLGDAKAKQNARVELRFSTMRGVILFNVDQ